MVYSRITASPRHLVQKGIETPDPIDGNAPFQTLPILIPDLGIKFQPIAFLFQDLVAKP
jgi:hypothetical protein